MLAGMPALKLRIQPSLYAVCRLAASEAPPSWLGQEPWVSLTRSQDELSVICVEERVPPEVTAERGLRLIRFEGPFAFEATGVLASVAGPLAEAGIPVLAVSTYDTDYVLVKAERLPEAVRVLRRGGHDVTA